MSEFTRRASVLIVDDSASMRSYVSELMIRAGYLVLEAEDGSACLNALESCTPDVVLLDVEMPLMTGLEVLRAIGLAPRLFSIILFTTQSSLEQIAAGLDLGADDYIVKPFQELDLLARIGAAVRNARQKCALARARKETEAAFLRLTRAQQKLVEQETVGAVARLAAGAAHHINNPLGFVMSNLSTLDRYAEGMLRFADDLARELTGKDPAALEAVAGLERQHRIRQIRRDLPYLIEETREGGQRIALIVQQMAQLELGLANQGTEELDLVHLLQPLVRMLAVLAPEGTEVEWSEPGHPVPVQGSLTLLNAALVALLKNACEALGTTAGSIGVAVAYRPGWAEISISDSGAGVTEEELPSLFDPFFTTKAPDSHVGLGLTIAQRFIAGHGGRISLGRTAARTRVTVEIPLAAAPPAPQN